MGAAGHRHGRLIATATLLSLMACGDGEPSLTPSAPEATASPTAQVTQTSPPATGTPTAIFTPQPTEAQGPTHTPTGTLDAAARLCDGAPLLTWQNFGEGFMIENCQSCHASTSPDRYGATESVTFDTYEETVAQKGRILARATGDSPTMPPGAGVSADDRYRLEVWLTCWE